MQQPATTCNNLLHTDGVEARLLINSISVINCRNFVFDSYFNMKTNQIKIVLTCYCNAVSNVNTEIGHVASFRNTLGIDIDNNEITPRISLRTVHFTNIQLGLLSNFKILIVVRIRDVTLPYLSSYEIV